MQAWSRKWMQRARNLAGSQLGGGFCCYWERIKDRPRLIVAHLNKVKSGHFSLLPEQVEAAYNARNLQELAATEAAIYLLRRGLRFGISHWATCRMGYCWPEAGDSWVSTGRTP